VSQFTPGQGGEAVRRRLGIAADTPTVVYVARMVREMGLHVLLDAIPPLLDARPECTFLLVGRHGDLTADAHALAARHPGHVFVVPDAPLADLPAYYDAATIAVAPSINARACLGLAIAEAMATAKPVIGARVGGTAEVLAEGETGLLVPPDDSRALAEAITSLIDDPAARERMGRLGRARALRHFDKESTNQRMEQIFDEVLA
jgi:phosphatidylinositol alpha-1,6-mannosyltransferase